MFYYALVDANKICTAVYAMPAQLSGSSYIEITEAQYNDPTLVGKKYVNGEWVEVVVYYYAILDAKNVVTNVYESQTEMPAADNLVAINFEQYSDPTLIGKYYDRANDQFITPPVSVIAEHSTDEIQYKEEEKTLSNKLDEMEQAIANAGGGSVVDAYTKAESDGKYAPIGAFYTKAESDERYALAGIGGATMTAAEILAALKSVDGSGSGLDADTLDGNDASYFASVTALNGKADANHTHDGYATTQALNAVDSAVAQLSSNVADFHSELNLVYDEINGKANEYHTHTGYAPVGHTHNASDIGAAPTNHTHTGYADANHTHTGYAATSHTHTASEVGAATSNHTHSGYASSTHTHTGYASSSHTHSDYFEKAGGTITGETNFSGGLVRVKGVQTLYHSGSQMVLSSENLATKICGNAITSSKTITVSSDERLKDDVKPLDKQALVDFMKQVKLVSYRYNDELEGTKHIGVIAQQLLEINPEIASYFVKEDENGYYSVDYSALSLLAVLALQ